MILHNDFSGLVWLRGLDLNQRPSGYEALPSLTNLLGSLNLFSDINDVQ